MGSSSTRLMSPANSWKSQRTLTWRIDLRRLLPFEPTHHKNDQLLGVQVNHFACGGTAIGVCISHKIADGTSAVQLAPAWANATKTGGSTPADHGVAPVSPKFDGASYFPAAAARDGANGTSREEVSMCKEKIVTKRLILDKNTIDSLKDQATTTLKNAPTRVEVVCAFIWNHLIKAAAGSSTSGSCSSRAVVAINLRPRMAPPIADNCSFGNFAWFAPTDSVNVGETQQFEKLVGMVREGITRVAQQVPNMDIAQLAAQAQGMLSSYVQNQESSNIEIIQEQLCSFTSWCRFPVYQVDFGWGTPIWGCTVTVPFTNMVVLMSTRCGQGIEAWISMLH